MDKKDKAQTQAIQWELKEGCVVLISGLMNRNDLHMYVK
jgi:hypothetical protein